MSKVTAGRFYEREGNHLTDLGSTPPRGEAVEVWVCRRLRDFPFGLPPLGGAIDTCSRCGAVIIYDPRANVDAPRVCFQCWGLTPMDIPGA